MIRFLDRWLSQAGRLSTILARSGGFILLTSAFVVGVDVIARKAFHVTVGGSDELSGYAFAITTSWALAFTLLHRANIRVDALYSRLPIWMASILDLLALISLTVFIGYLTYRISAVFEDSLTFSTRATTPLATPIWIPQLLWIVGFAAFFFAIIPLILRASVALLIGDFLKVRKLAGARSLEEDAEEETVQATNILRASSSKD